MRKKFFLRPYVEIEAKNCHLPVPKLKISKYTNQVVTYTGNTAYRRMQDKSNYIFSEQRVAAYLLQKPPTQYTTVLGKNFRNFSILATFLLPNH
jgi:hypothetical protein